MIDQEEDFENLSQESILTERLKELAYDENTSSWVETIYKSRTDRLISENNKIWTTGRIFIPISIGLFGVYANIDEPSLKQVFFLAAISITLLLIWQAISFVHKNFQTTHTDWLERIEKVMCLEAPKKKETWVQKIIKLGRIRNLLFYIVMGLWGLIIVNHPQVSCFWFWK